MDDHERVEQALTYDTASDQKRLDAADATENFEVTYGVISGDATVVLGTEECRIEGDGFVPFEND